MGNSSSSQARSKEHGARPSLRTHGSATSTATLKSGKPSVRESSSSSSTATGRSSTVSTGHVVNSGKRRKSIELPDLDPSLHFTSSQLQPASGLKGSVLPPEATRPTDTPEPEILLASHAHEVLQAQQGPPSVSLSETSGQMTPVTTPDSIALGANQSDSFISKGHGSLLPPLHPPADTIVAPPVPVHVSIPLGAGATATAASIVGSPWASGHNSPVTSPPLINASNDEPVFASLNTEALHIAASSNEVVQPSGTANTPSTQTSPTPQPLPVVAPLATLAAVSNPNAVEAVKAATVDLGAGPDGVPTLLTWTPGEGEGREGNPTNNPAGPSKVFVTGTFAKGWTTKIELGKKDQNDFTALVNLPPGPHSLKFIVDEQWKTSRNLPSATDPEGNLVNYLQVTKTSILPPAAGAGAPGQLSAEEERWMKEEAQWTNVIPEPLPAFGEATDAEDAAMEAHEEHNRRLMEQGVEPLPPPDERELSSHIMSRNFAPPPHIPAQLQRGVLNHVQVAQGIVGSGDDNSILPKPDHTVIDHLAASPINKGLLSVGVTKRYRRKFVTTVLYKPVPSGF